MIFKEPVPCPACGKKAKKMTERFSSLDGDEYKGNRRVLMDKSRLKWDENGNITGKITYLVLWDGESYTHDAGHFCTNRCAIDFANLGWSNLLRTKNKETEQ